MQKYAKTKDSGAEWVGAIPAHWAVKPLFALFRERQAPNYGNKETNVLSLSYGKIIRRDVESNFGLLPESFETYNIVEPENIVLRLTDLQNDKRSLRCGFVCERGIITSAYLTLEKLKGAEILPEYAFYLLHSYDMQKVFYSMGGGVRQTIKFEDFKKLPVFLPPMQEQVQIAKALSEKLKVIGMLLAKKKVLINLLKEERTGIISRAVTKGISSDVELKSTGVAWLGKIPKHWTVLPIKRLVDIPITDGPHETPVFYDAGVPFISAEAIKNDKIDFSKQRGYISRLDYELFSVKYKPRRGDIYMVKSGATTGNIAMVETDAEFNIWSPLAVIRPALKAVQPKFLFYYMKSAGFMSSVQVAWSYGTQQNIGMGVIGNLPVMLPPKEEQAAISAFLDKRLAVFENRIAAEIASRSLIEEYRTSLISAAVTGKVQV